MKIIKTKNYNQLSKVATEFIISEINKKPNMSIAFATGKTPKGLYKRLVKANKKKLVDFSKTKAFNLDEYYPIKSTNKKSFSYYLNKNLFNKINIKKSNITLLNGFIHNLDDECKNYEKKIKKEKIDIMILGVGVNGHIAFNEPGSKPSSKTRLVNLSKQTIKQNKLKNINQALTIGIKTILSSKKIILLASGKSKANAIQHLIKGKQNKKWPVSYLKKHKDLIVVVH
ncbi:MAG: glucosamine-6-phosphate deaminase [archaeon]